MRLIYIAGSEGSGITSLVKAVLEKKRFGKVGVIAHNIQSGMCLDGYCDVAESYSIKPCCARPRMLEFRMERMLEKVDVDTIITEPPGLSRETAAPILNRIYAMDKSKSIAPLTTVVDGNYVLENGIDRNNITGLSLYNQINESDCIVIHKSDLFGKEARDTITSRVSAINPECDILFTSSVTGENIDAFADILCNKNYRRPLTY